MPRIRFSRNFTFHVSKKRMTAYKAGVTYPVMRRCAAAVEKAGAGVRVEALPGKKK